MVHKFHASARRRLVEISKYTEETWGAEQADRYLDGLFAELDRIARRRHLLGVITVLHESMDIPNRLREDAEDSDKEDQAE